MAKGKKDPNAPKKPLSGYMLFCQDEREKVKKENSDLKAKEILTELGKRWGELGDDEKEEYNEKSKEAKEQYKKDYAEYIANKDSDEEESEEPKKGKKRKAATKKEKDPNAPKKPLTPFFMYSQKMRPEIKEENPDMAAKDVAKEIGARWKDLDDDEKKTYQDEYQEAMKAWKEEMADYQPAKKAKKDESDEDEEDDE
eukprot:TRINITY_DN2838_c0_g2_i1.p1 TRINITY_DN2838_c0_g2~~TRINITY_DN2838_c0_g2_i1.p1  ORF type:complete len:218 (+),score=129.05 TRINITY_DN2838_c0_g2_i1:62-655(+)